MRSIVAIMVLVAVGVQGVSAACTPISMKSRRLMQSSTNAQATAIENLGNQTTNQVANASSSAVATSTSYTPLPRKQPLINSHYR